jgi:hypothetical protein
LPEQSSFTALATDLTLAARKAFFTVVWQERSWAVSAMALELVTARARAATAKTIINFLTGFWTPFRVMSLPL